MKELKQYEILRNEVLLHVRESGDNPLSINDLLDKPSIKTTMRNSTQVQTLLKNMYDSGQLRRVRINRPGDQSIYAYEMGEGRKTASAKVAVEGTHKLNIHVGRNGEYIDVTIKGIHLKITVGD